MSEPRPTRITHDIAMVAARELAKQIVHAEPAEPDGFEGADDAAIADMAAQIAEVGEDCPDIDGYELMVALDRRHGWEGNFATAEILNEFSHEAHEELRRLEREWFSRNPMEPPLPIGSRIKLRDGKTGEISEIYQHGPAKYLVKMDGGASNSRRIVNFEDVQPE